MGEGTLGRGLCRAAAISALILSGLVRGQDAEELPPRFDVELVEPADLERAARGGTPWELHLGGVAHQLLVEPVDLRSYRFKATTWDRDGRSTITVEFDREYVDHFSDLVFTPEVEQITPFIYEVALARVEPGQTHVVEVEMLGKDYWLHEGEITAFVEASQPLTVEVGTLVFP